MSHTIHLMKLEMDCEAVILQIKCRLSELGLRVVRSFDLQSAIISHADLTCSHHSDTPYDCQYAVLLAYGNKGAPASLVVHSYTGQTQVHLVNSPDHKPDPKLIILIRKVLVPNNIFSAP